MMKALGKAVVLIGVLAGLGCSDRDAGKSGPNAARTANASVRTSEAEDLRTLAFVGLSTPGQSVCRIDLLENYSAVQVLRASRGTGGATCYEDGLRLLFFPYQGGCLNPLGDPGTQKILTAGGTASQLSRCMAVVRNSDPDAALSIVMTPSRPDHAESVDAFHQFTLDLYGLASHGALEVTHLGMANGILCAEIDDPHRVVGDIERAEIVDGDLVSYEVREESCAAASLTLTDLPWPERLVTGDPGLAHGNPPPRQTGRRGQ